MENNDVLDQQNKYYGSYLKIKNNPRYKKVWQYLKENNLKGRILDIGCADGNFSETLAKKGYDCYGLEYLEEAIKDCTGKGIKVVQGSFLEKFPFEDNFFDLVFAGEVVEHTIDDLAFLGEINRVLKRGGILILTTPNLVSLGNRWLMLFGKLPRFAYSEFHYRIYTTVLIKNKIIKANFKIKKIDSNYVLISTFFNKSIGKIGEWLGSKLPNLGENLILYAKNDKK